MEVDSVEDTRMTTDNESEHYHDDYDRMNEAHQEKPWTHYCTKVETVILSTYDQVCKNCGKTKEDSEI